MKTLQDVKMPDKASRFNDMTTIWKWELKLQTIQEISMPVGAKILCAQLQRGIPCIWASCNPALDRSMRIIKCIVTGEECTIIDDYKYISTLIYEDGLTVIHIYELKR